MPRDSLIAQITCWSLPAIVEAAVLGLPFERPVMLPLVVGRIVVVVGYDVLAVECEVDARDLRPVIEP